MGNPLPDPDDTDDPDDSAVTPRQETRQGRPEELADPAIRAAFTAFYRKSVPRLVAFLRWQGAPLPDARDCVQDTMLAAFRQWRTLHEPYAWCRVVAAHTYARRLATVREDPTDDEPACGHALGADHELEVVEQRHAVLRALDRLPFRQRQVMAWSYDGATPTEIAEILKISPAAARGSLCKARAALRDYLDEIGGELR